MKFALLGVDDEVLALARDVVARGQEIAAVFEPGPFAYDLHALAPDARSDDQWESLLLAGIAEAVIIGRAQVDAEIRADQLRKLAQAAVPMIVFHPACEYIVGYEIEMIRKDVGGVIVPYFPGMIDANVTCPFVFKGPQPFGDLQQLQFERRITAGAPQAVLDVIARDAVSIRVCVGSINKLSAIGSLEGNESSRALSVQMTAESGAIATWSLGPPEGDIDALLTLIGAKGRVVVERSISDGWKGRTNHDAKVIELLQALIAKDANARVPLGVGELGADHLQALIAKDANARVVWEGVTWLDACRALEIAGTVPRCLERGKTIELYNEEHTEEGAFKGTMAVGGCLILMLLFFATVFVAIVEGLQLRLHTIWIWKNWAIFLLAPIVFFLILQVLGYLAKRDTNPKR